MKAGLKDHWEAVYRSRPPEDASWYQQRPERSLSIIERSKVSQREPVIDIGAGASTLVDFLLSNGYQDITALDISEQALQASRTRLANKAEAVNWVVTDALTFQPPCKYALWHDRAVFHFLIHEKDVRRYLEVLRSGVAKNGTVVIATFSLDGPDRCSGLPVERYDAEKLMARFGDGFRLIEETRERHLTPWGDTQDFRYFCIERTDRIL